MATTATYSTAILELSQAAYDEIERKLLEAGYDHVFERGPGSAIDMHGIAVTREADLTRRHAGLIQMENVR